MAQGSRRGVLGASGTKIFPALRREDQRARIPVSGTASTAAAPTLSAEERRFPALTPTQIARVAAQGRARPVRPGEPLFEAGDQVVPFIVVTKGQVEVLQPADGREVPIAVLGPGQFTGEVNMLSGRRALVRAGAIAQAR